MALASGLMVSLAWVGAALACEGWNAGEVIRTATVVDVQRCLNNRATLEPRDEDRITPMHFAAGEDLNLAVKAKHVHLLDPGCGNRLA